MVAKYPSLIKAEVTYICIYWSCWSGHESYVGLKPPMGKSLMLPAIVVIFYRVTRDICSSTLYQFKKSKMPIVS